YTGTAANVARIRSRTDAIQPEHSVSYTYDSLYRLRAVTAPNPAWSINWEIDAYGNRTSQTRTGPVAAKIATQTLGYTNNRFSSGFIYDEAGNIKNDLAFNYFYDAEGRLT